MSKITFRADDDLVAAIEEFDASKSEVMRRALRQYLDSHSSDTSSQATTADPSGTIDDLIADRVDTLVADAIDRQLTTPDVNVNISLDSATSQVQADRHQSQPDDEQRMTTQTPDTPSSDTEDTCEQCGQTLSSDDIYCPNCGEKVSRRLFCECGDEIRSDWAFCPSCGRRTPAADVLDPDHA